METVGIIVQAGSAAMIAVLTFFLVRVTRDYADRTREIAAHNATLVDQTRVMAGAATRASDATVSSVFLQVAPILVMNRDPKGTFRGASSGTYLDVEWINIGNGPAINIKFGAEWDIEHGADSITVLDREFIAPRETRTVKFNLDHEYAEKYIAKHGTNAAPAMFMATYNDFFGNEYRVSHRIGEPLAVRIERTDGTVVEL